MLLKLGYFSATFDVYTKDLSDHEYIRCNGYDIRTMGMDHDGIPALAYSIEEHERPGRFNKAKALELGIPEGPLFGKLQRGETIKLGNRVITPDMVLGKPRRGRKIVYSGDTRPLKPFIEFAKNCDVLIHDATLDSSLEIKARKYGHSTAKDAAQIAKATNAKVLFLVHISPRYKEVDVLEKDAKQIFEHTIVPHDLLEYTVKVSD
jgi:ribonuclease Z